LSRESYTALILNSTQGYHVPPRRYREPTAIHRHRTQRDQPDLQYPYLRGQIRTLRYQIRPHRLPRPFSSRPELRHSAIPFHDRFRSRRVESGWLGSYWRLRSLMSQCGMHFHLYRTRNKLDGGVLQPTRFIQLGRNDCSSVV
jgi:hypothetical protein